MKKIYNLQKEMNSLTSRYDYLKLKMQNLKNNLTEINLTKNKQNKIKAITNEMEIIAQNIKEIDGEIKHELKETMNKKNE